MTKQYSILFIDDNDPKNDVELLKKRIGRSGKVLDIKTINVKEGQFKDNNGISFDKLKGELLKDENINYDFDIVACDFDFADEEINGYKVLTWLINTANTKPKKRIRRAKFVFYTGDARDLENVAREDVKKLLRIKIEKIISRAKLPEELAKIIYELDSKISLEESFVNLLSEHKELVFQSTFPTFRGKTLGEICDLIESENPSAATYLDALIEQTVAHMVSLQEGE